MADESKVASPAPYPTLEKIVEEATRDNKDLASPEVQNQLWDSLSYSFGNLFPGNPAGFYHRHDDGSYEAVDHEATLLDDMAHLCGYPDRGMLKVPLLPSGK